jgi:hypothetical protein
MVVYKHHHASVTNFFNISPNTNQLFEYRKCYTKRKSMKELYSYFVMEKERVKRNSMKNSG